MAKRSMPLRLPACSWFKLLTSTSTSCPTPAITAFALACRSRQSMSWQGWPTTSRLLLFPHQLLLDCVHVPQRHIWTDISQRLSRFRSTRLRDGAIAPAHPFVLGPFTMHGGSPQAETCCYYRVPLMHMLYLAKSPESGS